jgi:hypothetical protein
MTRLLTGLASIGLLVADFKVMSEIQCQSTENTESHFIKLAVYSEGALFQMSAGDSLYRLKFSGFSLVSPDITT